MVRKHLSEEAASVRDLAESAEAHMAVWEESILGREKSKVGAWLLWPNSRKGPGWRRL